MCLRVNMYLYTCVYVFVFMCMHTHLHFQVHACACKRARVEETHKARQQGVGRETGSRHGHPQVVARGRRKGIGWDLVNVERVVASETPPYTSNSTLLIKLHPPHDTPRLK